MPCIFMSVKNNKILGIDYGDFSIGLAVFDFETRFTYPYKTIFRAKANVLRKSLREIIDIIVKEKITEVVVGYPLNMDDTEGERIDKVKVFTKMLETKLIALKESGGLDYIVNSKVDKDSLTNAHLYIPISFQDERLTTKEADEILSDREIQKSKRKEYIDQVAAEIILNDYVNSRL